MTEEIEALKVTEEDDQEQEPGNHPEYKPKYFRVPFGVDFLHSLGYAKLKETSGFAALGIYFELIVRSLPSGIIEMPLIDLAFVMRIDEKQLQNCIDSMFKLDLLIKLENGSIEIPATMSQIKSFSESMAQSKSRKNHLRKKLNPKFKVKVKSQNSDLSCFVNTPQDKSLTKVLDRDLKNEEGQKETAPNPKTKEDDLDIEAMFREIQEHSSQNNKKPK